MIFYYIILGFVFAAGMGPANIETVKRGLMGNFFSASFFYLGNTIIDAAYIIVVAFGFSFFDENMIFKVVFEVLGICYLFYLGIGNLKDYWRKKLLVKDERLQTKRALTSFLEGIIVNLANPFAVASWVAFYAVVSSDFNKSFMNFFAVVFGSVLLGLSLILITYLFRRVISEKIMRVVSLLSGVALIVFSGAFVYDLLSLFKGY
ncbi:MAG: LysE family transporter [Candidatus Gracilibacteria bacterium]